LQNIIPEYAVNSNILKTSTSFAEPLHDTKPLLYSSLEKEKMVDCDI